MVDQQISLGNVGSRAVIAQKKDDDGGLGIGVLAKDSTAKSSEKLRSRRDHGRLFGRWLGVELLMEEVVVEVGLCSKGIEASAVVLTHSVDQSGGELSTMCELLGVVEIDLRR